MTHRLMCVLAHPDDESLGTGGTLAKYATEGVETYLVTATGGEYGWFGAEEDYPGPEALRAIREEELQCAAEVLNICEVNLLEYEDGKLDRADPERIIGQIVAHLRRVQPDVLITFGPFGVYGHPDHIAICQLTTAAVMRAADANYQNQYDEPHQVAKLYYMVANKAKLTSYQEAFGDLVMTVDGDERRAEGWSDWAITTHISTLEYAEQVWEAVSCHQTQLPGYSALRDLPDEEQRSLWQAEQYYRAFSLVNNGREPETDLFAGIG